MKTIKVRTSAIVIYEQIYKVSDKTNLDDVINLGIPNEAIFVDTLDEEFVGYTDILEAEEIE